MRRYTVRLAGSPEIVAKHQAVLATLPEHFEVTEATGADVALVSDGAIDADSSVVVVSNPLIVANAETKALPAMRYAPRVLSEPSLKSEQSSAYVLYDCVVCIGESGRDDLRRALLEQMAALRAISGDRPCLSEIVRLGEGYLAFGSLSRSGARVALTSVATQARGPSFTLTAVGLQRRIEIEIHDDGIARPMRVSTFGPSGAMQPSLVHQNSDRLTWIAAYSLLGGDEGGAYGGDAWREDLAEVFRVLN